MKVPSDDEINDQARRVAEALVACGETMATAESCTGGWVAKVCTDLSGSSAWFTGGFVTYSNDLKHQLLGVTEADLELHGAVSEPVVRAMVAGACRAANSDWAVAVSGIAGPSGGTVEKPVGTVWYSWGTTEQTQARCELFSGNRDDVRRQAVKAVLQALYSDVIASR